MRRLQSFKTPSRLNEKLKFSNKSNNNNDATISNGTKFVPNISAFDSNEVLNNSAQTNNTSLRSIQFDEKSDLEKVEQTNTLQSFDLPLIKAINRYEAPNKSGKQILIYDKSNNISVEPTIDNQTAGVCNHIAESGIENIHSKLEGWSVFQLPKYMPESKKNSYEISKNPIPTILHDTPSGSIGKLIFRRDGNMDLRLNPSKDEECTSFEVDCISKDNSEQFIVAFSKINELINLGKCDSLLIATPRIQKY
ncbi:RNA polymerase III RPC4 family protein [Cryptosporidium meleagridis]|uniref:RNA polymerase III RPC4 family protein n=1 Tax=Cryptosporidium meleagridis TaxID=93969 RepID=A0A2P4Z3V4_9CRYT|nr:RNA polymerase III RPC4 family protein [Cryptosporidium meleagridis]